MDSKEFSKGLTVGLVTFSLKVIKSLLIFSLSKLKGKPGFGQTDLFFFFF